MKRTYLGAICGTPGSYGIVFRDLPGCVSVADTIEEVLTMGAEAVSGHIESMLDYGDPIPEPSTHSLTDVVDWLRDPDDEDDNGPWVDLVPIEVDIPSVADTLTVRLKADLVKRIAELAQVPKELVSSRAFIERAIEHELEAVRRSAA